MVVPFLTIIVSYGVSILTYSNLPFQMVTHWNMYGVADGFSIKPFGAFLLPVLMTIIIPLLYYLPNTDPFKKNIRSFWGAYTKFITTFSLFFLYLHIIVIAWNLGVSFPFVSYVLPAFSVFFYMTGTLLKQTKRNWFIGIRTPWTVSDDTNWKKTHALGATLFRGVSIVTLIGMLFPAYAFIFFIISIILAALVPIFYSYYLFRYGV